MLASFKNNDSAPIFDHIQSYLLLPSKNIQMDLFDLSYGIAW